MIVEAASLISLRPQPLMAKIVKAKSVVIMFSFQFGEISKGSLSYQCPAVLPKDILTHPNDPHLGASPDVKVVDPNEEPPYGLPSKSNLSPFPRNRSSTKHNKSTEQIKFTLNIDMF